jgi:ribosomal protein S18 acetylase RimI-like enzyme
MQIDDIPAVVALQADAFPPPFNPDFLWQSEHLFAHIQKFPHGQFVAEETGSIIGSCSNTLILETVWDQHGNWSETVGGPFLEGFTPDGEVLYGLDISVAPASRRRGVGRAFYQARFELVHQNALRRYGTACRLPDFAASGLATPTEFATAVASGEAFDRTLTPLLSYGLTFLGIIDDYMEDPESGNAAALLERPREEALK